MKSVYYYLSVLIIFLSACHTNKSELETLKSATPFPKCYLHKEKWTFDS